MTRPQKLIMLRTGSCELWFLGHWRQGEEPLSEVDSRTQYTTQYKLWDKNQKAECNKKKEGTRENQFIIFYLMKHSHLAVIIILKLEILDLI